MDLLASDSLNNQFTGAFNPDSRLAVQFYSKLVKNDFESEKQQRSIHASVDFIRIMTPGDKLNIIDTFARPEHQARFPMQWHAYKNRSDANTHIMGTPIAEWTRISPSQAEELRGLKFYTVESIAGASDAQLQGIGMIAGVSAYTFRDDAKRFLSVAEAASKLSEADKRVADADAKIEAMQAEFAAKQAAQEARMDALLAALESQTKVKNVESIEKFEPSTQSIIRSGIAEKEDKPRRGRPKQVEVTEE